MKARVLVTVLAALAGAELPAAASPGLVFHQTGDPAPAEDTGALSADATAWANLEVDWLHRFSAPGGAPLLAGAGIELPLLVWAQAGSADASRLAGRLTWVPWRRGRLLIVGEVSTRVGFQRSYMDTLVGWDAGVALHPGVRWRRGGFGLLLGVHQGLSTYVNPGDVATDAFTGRYPDDLYGDGPRSGWVAFPARRFQLGLVGSVRLTHRVALAGAFGLVYLDKWYDAGLLDTMAMGVWPFFASASTCVDL